jgi:arylsulfatase A-like enzyme
VRSIDILPTLLDIVDIPADDGFEGLTLLPLIKGIESEERLAVSQRDTINANLPSSIRTQEWKLIETKLYNLVGDPREQKPVSNMEMERNLYSELWDIFNKKKVNYEPEKAKIDDINAEQLKALGYFN